MAQAGAPAQAWGQQTIDRYTSPARAQHNSPGWSASEGLGPTNNRYTSPVRAQHNSPGWSASEGLRASKQ
ncbi:hypothetical protein KK078_25805 [Fulvivirgaceae bacterium PWU37]|uniref:Uncharacterized protein n=1 Tax=Dawidia soli TaxID=2782352 RepID=A0AAP2GKY1_9BACT|nr:hypothetical protein [Dawidia soli]